MEFLIFLVIILAVLIGPIKIAAKIVGAKNSGFFACFIAILFSAAIHRGVEIYFPGLGDYPKYVGDIVSFGLAGIAYMMVLGTTFFKGLAIAVIQIILTLVVVTFVSAWVIGVLGLK